LLTHRGSHRKTHTHTHAQSHTYIVSKKIIHMSHQYTRTNAHTHIHTRMQTHARMSAHMHKHIHILKSISSTYTRTRICNDVRDRQQVWQTDHLQGQGVWWHSSQARAELVYSWNSTLMCPWNLSCRNYGSTEGVPLLYKSVTLYASFCTKTAHRTMILNRM